MGLVPCKYTACLFRASPFVHMPNYSSKFPWWIWYGWKIPWLWKKAGHLEDPEDLSHVMRPTSLQHENQGLIFKGFGSEKYCEILAVHDKKRVNSHAKSIKKEQDSNNTYTITINTIYRITSIIDILLSLINSRTLLKKYLRKKIIWQKRTELLAMESFTLSLSEALALQGDTDENEFEDLPLLVAGEKTGNHACHLFSRSIDKERTRLKGHRIQRLTIKNGLYWFDPILVWGLLDVVSQLTISLVVWLGKHNHKWANSLILGNKCHSNIWIGALKNVAPSGTIISCRNCVLDSVGAVTKYIGILRDWISNQLIRRLTVTISTSLDLAWRGCLYGQIHDFVFVLGELCSAFFEFLRDLVGFVALVLLGVFVFLHWFWLVRFGSIVIVTLVTLWLGRVVVIGIVSILGIFQSTRRINRCL